MRPYLTHGLCAALIALVAACTGLETGNGGDEPGPGPDPAPSETAIQIALTGAEPGVYSGEDQDGRPLLISEAAAWLGRLSLTLPPGEHCKDLPNPGQAKQLGEVQSCSGRTVRVEGPWRIDLVTGETEPPLSEIQLRPGTYESLELELRPAGDATTDALSEHALIASGRLDTDAGFELGVEFEGAIVFEGVIEIHGDRDTSVLAGFDVTAWFSGLPLTRCALDGDLQQSGDRVVLDQGQGDCAASQTSLRDAIAGSAFLAAP